MRIGIDARMLGPHTGGIGRYTEQLVQHLAQLSSEHTFVLFLTQKNWDAVPESDHFEKVKADIHWYGWKEQLQFPKIIKRAKIDMMHFPHWNVPLLYRGKFLVTIHDLIMFHYPRPDATTHGPFVYWIKDMIHRVIVNHAARKAKRIITPTQWVAQDVADTLRVSREKIDVTYEAPLPPLPPSASTPHAELGIDTPYCIYVGSGYPHENLKQLIDVWESVNEGLEEPHQLVLVGSSNRFYQRLEEGAKGVENIIFTGFVSDEALAELYRGAALCVFPSLSEGFGLPPIEAMTYGVPVASSNASCMPEVYGEAALYFDPESREQMVSVIVRALSDESVRHELNAKAKGELKRFSWRKMTEETLSIYDRYK